MWTPGAAAAVVVAAAAVLAAQGTGFEVASIKRNHSGAAGASLDLSRGQLRATNLPIRTLIPQAFDILDTQVVGAPAWLADERYDILAGAPDGVTTAAAMRPLLRALLAERFKLATHRERREMPVFALVRARQDGRFGPGFREAPIDCAAAAQAGAPSAPQPQPTEEWPSCTVRFTPGLLYVGGYRMAEVLRLLTPLVGRTILDETGIAGAVQMRLAFRPQGRGAPPPDGAIDDRPDLFTAIEEQTGLKLEGRRAPVDVLVIDAIERPTAD